MAASGVVMKTSEQVSATAWGDTAWQSRSRAATRAADAGLALATACTG